MWGQGQATPRQLKAPLRSHGQRQYLPTSEFDYEVFTADVDRQHVGDVLADRRHPGGPLSIVDCLPDFAVGARLHEGALIGGVWPRGGVWAW